MNQTEIDELRRLHEADSAKIINAMANIDWQQHLMNAGGCFHVEDDGRLCGRADRWSGHGEPDFHMFVPLYVAATKLAKGNALPRLLAALDEARAERSEARSLLLNGIQTNGDSLAFLEHVRREHAAVVAERDALKAKLAGADDERDAYGADIHSVLEKSVGLVAERDALRAERDKANLRERNIFASLRMALGEDLGGGGGLVEILNGIEGLQDQRDAAESLAWDALGRPDGTHDMSNVQRLCEAHIALKAKLAALVDYLRDEIATSSKAVPSTADEAIGDSERVLFCQQLLRHEALAAAKVQP